VAAVACQSGLGTVSMAIADDDAGAAEVVPHPEGMNSLQAVKPQLARFSVWNSVGSSSISAKARADATASVLLDTPSFR
jgi:hypothetical protein